MELWVYLSELSKKVCVRAKSLKPCPTLCNSMDCSLPGSSVRGILQARRRVCCCALLQGSFLTQGLNPCLLCLLHWPAGSLPLARKWEGGYRTQSMNGAETMKRKGEKERELRELKNCQNLMWRRQWHPTPVLLPGKSHGRRSLVGCRVGHNWATSLSLFTFMRWRRKWQLTPVFLRIPETEEPSRLPSVGSHRVGHDWSDAAAAEFNARKIE